MANIEDYLDWRADIPFEVDPFNEVDSLILCELVYTDFEDIVPGPGLNEKISIEDACNLFFSKYSKEELMARLNATKVAPFLMQRMAFSKRFGGTKLAYYVNEVDALDQSQFAACCFYLPDGTVYVAFRGTDDSLVGWKEDFNMCFSSGTGGQLKASEYLNKNFGRSMRPLRIGGHSKGGNFAVYAAAFSESHIKDTIIDVYNHDGPGFIKEILKTDGYKSIIKKVHKFVPVDSIIGMLMQTKAKVKVVESNAKGINQHDPMTWQVTRNCFTKRPTISDSAKRTDEIIKKWAVKFDYETREAFGDIFFESLAASGATKLSHITSKKARSIASITKEIQKLSPENQALVMDVFTSLVAVWGDGLKNSILSKLPIKK